MGGHYLEDDMLEQPDNWVVLKMNGPQPCYKVLAGWSGGYLTGDEWRLNSGIVKVDEEEDHFLFYGTSGSCYQCAKGSYGLRMNNAYIYDKMKDKFGDAVELPDEDTDWSKTDWLIS